MFQSMYYHVKESYFCITANYSRLYVCFGLERKTGFYFMELYIPATLIVTVAWLICISEDGSFSDMLQVLLAMLFLYLSYITLMPKVSHFKAMDLYLVMCFTFVFLFLVKTYLSREVFVHSLNRKVTDKNEKKIYPNFENVSEEKREFLKRIKIHFVDLLFLVLYFTFCMCYFIYYVNYAMDYADFNRCP